MSLSLPDPARLGVWVAAILTLMIYSRLLRDNPLSRLAEHLFVGAAVGYVSVVAWSNVLWPRLVQPLLTAPVANADLLAPALLGLMLLARPVRALRPLASIPLAYIIAVGAALSVAGAIAGSLLPQTSATMLSLAPSQGTQTLVNNAIVIAGVLSTVLYFYFTARPESAAGGVLRGVSIVGRWTMILTFGAVFATTVMSRFSLLVGRAQFLLGDWLGLVK